MVKSLKAGVNLRGPWTASIAELKISSKVATPSPLVSIKSKSSALFSWSKRWNPIAYKIVKIYLLLKP